jgi:hypothetical protein
VNGAPVSETASFALEVYSIVFSEAGLPLSTNWTVTLGGTSHDSVSSTITVYEPNGTYSYRLGIVPGWTTSAFLGKAIVDGMPTLIRVPWTLTPFSVYFSERGLQSGAEWSVALGGVLQSSSSTSIRFVVGNGSYSYTVEASMEFNATPASGVLIVNGSDLTKTIEFTAKPRQPTPGPALFGLTGVIGQALFAGAMLASVLGALIVFLRQRRRKDLPPRAKSSRRRPLPRTGGPPIEGDASSGRVK